MTLREHDSTQDGVGKPVASEHLAAREDLLSELPRHDQDAAQPADVLELIELDHQAVQDALDDLLATDPHEIQRRGQLLSGLERMLLQQLSAEEQVLYQALEARLLDRRAVLDGAEQHRAIRAALQDLTQLVVSDERWRPRLSILAELVDHHVYSEEDGLFQATEELLDDDAALELGGRYLRSKRTPPAP